MGTIEAVYEAWHLSLLSSRSIDASTWTYVTHDCSWSWLRVIIRSCFRINRWYVRAYSFSCVAENNKFLEKQRTFLFALPPSNVQPVNPYVLRGRHRNYKRRQRDHRINRFATRSFIIDRLRQRGNTKKKKEKDELYISSLFRAAKENDWYPVPWEDTSIVSYSSSVRTSNLINGD